jgi:hypothetical protein
MMDSRIKVNGETSEVGDNNKVFEMEPLIESAAMTREDFRIFAFKCSE